MNELRKDYILERWVIISEGRGKRPHELRQSNKAKENECVFCPGNEHLTPEEIGRVPNNGTWKVRWMENKFAALKQEGNANPNTDNRFYTFANAYGYHEVIVETARHDRTLVQLSIEDIEQLLHVFARRIVSLEAKPSIKYVSVFKNHGYEAGTSLLHSHSQLMALAQVPTEILEKVKAMRKFLSCPYCSIIKAESASTRLCFENNEFVAFTPYASRFHYEIWVFPKMHIARLEHINFAALAEILKKILTKIAKANLDYNLLFQYGPKGIDFHFHIEICPREAIWGGFELCTGIVINSVSPEDAAAFYRSKS